MYRAIDRYYETSSVCDSKSFSRARNIRTLVGEPARDPVQDQ